MSGVDDLDDIDDIEMDIDEILPPMKEMSRGRTTPSASLARLSDGGDIYDLTRRPQRVNKSKSNRRIKSKVNISSKHVVKTDDRKATLASIPKSNKLPAVPSLEDDTFTGKNSLDRSIQRDEIDSSSNVVRQVPTISSESHEDLFSDDTLDFQDNAKIISSKQNSLPNDSVTKVRRSRTKSTIASTENGTLRSPTSTSRTKTTSRTKSIDDTEDDSNDESIHPGSSSQTNLKSQHVHMSPRPGTYRIATHITGMSVEDNLISKGYIPIHRVIIRNNDTDTVEFIKARSEYGFFVYVEIDDDGYVISKSDSRTYRKYQGVIIPESIKSGSYREIGNNVPGVAIECSRGICLMRQSSTATSRPVETNLVHISELPEESIKMEDYPIAYPIVKLSEINTNNDLVLTGIVKSTADLRNTAFGDTFDGLKELKDSIDNLDSNVNSFVSNMESLTERTRTTMNRLKKYMADYKIGTLNDDETRKYRTIVEQLAKGNDLITKMLLASRRVINNKSTIDMISSEVESLEQLLNESFHKISK